MKRIVSIDVLRGFALLGILLMNVVSFAYPYAAYFNPNAYDETMLNTVVFSINHVLFDQKMMGLFSLLFGASLMLIASVLAEKGRKVLGVYYSRTFWLLVIGLFHSIFIWEGDVLTVYAVCGLFLYWCRNWSVMVQFTAGMLLFLAPAMLQLILQFDIMALGEADSAMLAEIWQPATQTIAKEIALRQSSYLEQLAAVISPNQPMAATLAGELFYSSFYVEVFGRAAGMMLIGMALYTSGVLTNRKSLLFYKRLLVIGFGVGLPLTSWGLWQYIQHDWHHLYSSVGGRVWNNLATGFTVAGYIGLVMLWNQSQLWSGLRERLQAVGRMALTNYIMHSLLGLLIFNGVGLGLFAQLNRLEQFGFVIGVWVLQLVLSPWWLARFRYGPLEWCWRCLTYLQWQPLKRAN